MYEHLLVMLDASPLAECAVPHAAAIADFEHARVSLVRVLEPPAAVGSAHPIDPVVWDVQRDEACRYLDAVAAPLRARGLDVEGHVLEGVPSSEVIDYARANDVDLVVLSSHGRSGLLGWSLGSVGRKTLERVHLDLLLIRAFGSDADAEEPTVRYARVLVPLDGSHRAESVVPVACRVADAHGSELVLVHVVREPEMVRQIPLEPGEADLQHRVTTANRRHAQAYLEGLAERLASCGREVRTRVLEDGSAADALHEVVAELRPDLVIASAHGSSGSTRRPFGSTVSDLIAYGEANLLVVQDRGAHELQPSAAERASAEHAGHE